ncbi:MAG TPA: hypothetical protein DDZ80_12940 [Cyanobacteria bacterium UBA8803]|nr:hypothetical protein [Cyanobacteria bacterium UBA9273]HBL59380.1 hypothetical protein [Cyanobacteria bacterium UBA8803]
MASSDEFREQLKAGNITEALALALGEAAKLRITTWVASGSEDLTVARAKPGYRLRTHINTVEGAIENEIGDQFLGNGPYRELLPFHLEQVNQGNQMIENNLKSLQKLFEVLVTLRHEAATHPTIESEWTPLESQLLPSPSLEEAELAIEPQELAIADGGGMAESAIAEEMPAGGLAIEPQESGVTDWDLAERAVAEEMPAEGLAIEPQESGVTDWDLAESSLLEETAEATAAEVAIKPQEFLLEEDITPKVVLPDSQEALAELPDEDGAILDFLESLPEPPSPGPESLDQELDEDEWEDFVEEELQLESELSELPVGDEDWEILTEDWGSLTLEEFEPPPESPEAGIEISEIPLNEDREDTVKLQEPAPEPETPVQRLESLEANADEDWDDWIVEDSEMRGGRSLGLVEEEEWGDLTADFDPFAAPSLTDSPSDLEIDEDWDEFAVEELQPYAETIDVESSFELSDPLEELASPESELNVTDKVDLSKNLETDALKETGEPLDELDRPPPMAETKDWLEEPSNESMEFLFEDSESSDNPFDSDILDDGEAYTMEEALFDEISLEEFEEFSIPIEESEMEMDSDDFEPLLESDDDWDDDPNPGRKQEPPSPPPPTRFSNPKN